MPRKRKMTFMTHRMAKQLAAYEKMLDAQDLDYAELKERVAQEKERLWAQEVNNAKATAYLDAIKQAEAAKIRADAKNDFESYPRLKEYAEYLKPKQAKTGIAQFITINPKPGVPVHEFKETVEKYARSVMHGSVQWVYEQRGQHELELGKGMHAHILSKPLTNPADFHKRTRATFAKYVGNEQHIDIRPVPDSASYDRRVKYMTGEKLGDEKLVKVSMDKLWRTAEKLSAWYIYPHADPQDPDSSEGGGDRPSRSGGADANEGEGIHAV